jgi:hypothetical protein
MNDKIKLPALKKVLQSLDADETTTQLVLNTAKLYNQLLDKLAKGEKVHPYMLTGTNGQVFNQLLQLKKLKQKDKKDDADPFDEFVNNHKKKAVL